MKRKNETPISEQGLIRTIVKLFIIKVIYKVLKNAWTNPLPFWGFLLFLYLLWIGK